MTILQIMATYDTSTSSKDTSMPPPGVTPHGTSLEKRIKALNLAPDRRTSGESTGTRLPFFNHYDLPTPKYSTTSVFDLAHPFRTPVPSLFSLIAPETARQPLYTVVNVYEQNTRRKFYDFYHYPVVYSEYGAPAASTLTQLDNPLPKVSVSDREVTALLTTTEGKAVQAVTPSYPTIYGATRTTTFTTTVTAEVGDVVFLKFPTPTPTGFPLLPTPLEWATRKWPGVAASKDYPNGLPVLVLTQVEGVVVNTMFGSGTTTTLITATVVQGVPPAFTTEAEAAKLGRADLAYQWGTWGRGERAGVVVASVLCVVLIGALVGYLMWMRGRRMKKSDDEERKTEGEVTEQGNGRSGLFRRLIGLGKKTEKRADRDNEEEQRQRQRDDEGEGEDVTNDGRPIDEGIDMAEIGKGDQDGLEGSEHRGKEDIQGHRDSLDQYRNQGDARGTVVEGAPGEENRISSSNTYLDPRTVGL